jgi:SH3 domain protein
LPAAINACLLLLVLFSLPLTAEIRADPRRNPQATPPGDPAPCLPLKHELLQTQQALQTLQAQNQRQTQELAELRQAATQPQQLLVENQQLREQQVNLAHERDLLRQEAQTLKQRNAQDWFIVGAGVLLAGLGLGLVLPRLHATKQRRWDEI